MIYREAGAAEAARKPQRCEFCQRWSNTGLDAAHIFSRGAGECTIPENLVFLCRLCHSLSHSGHPPRLDDLLGIAARRHGVRPVAIQEAVFRIRRLDKAAGQEAVDAILNELRAGHAATV